MNKDLEIIILEELRENNNYKAKDIANFLKVAKSTYSEWENNKISIPTRRLIQLADFYNINIDYIIRLSKSKITILNNTNINLKDIGNRLKEARLSLGLSLRKLGIVLNSSFSALASYERGEHLIHIDLLIEICRRSNYSVDYILGRSNDKYINN